MYVLVVWVKYLKGLMIVQRIEDRGERREDRGERREGLSRVPFDLQFEPDRSRRSPG